MCFLRPHRGLSGLRAKRPKGRVTRIRGSSISGEAVCSLPGFQALVDACFPLLRGKLPPEKFEVRSPRACFDTLGVSMTSCHPSPPPPPPSPFWRFWDSLWPESGCRKDLLPPRTNMDLVKNWLLYILRKKKLRALEAPKLGACNSLTCADGEIILMVRSRSGAEVKLVCRRVT